MVDSSQTSESESDSPPGDACDASELRHAARTLNGLADALEAGQITKAEVIESINELNRASGTLKELRRYLEP